MNGRRYGLDLARLIAAYLVLFGHFVLEGTFGVHDRKWVGKSEALPLLNKDNQSAWIIDTYLLDNWKTTTAIIGVALFFIISGWIVPPMLHRYSRFQFLLNRFFRIFPMLIAAVLASAAIQYQFGDFASLRFFDIISTLSLTNQFSGNPMTLGVIWTLIVEFKFYLLLALVGRLNYARIFCAIVAMFFLLGVQIILVKQGYYSVASHALLTSNFMIHDFYYIIFMLCGSGLWLLINKDKTSKKPIKEIALTLLIILSFNIYRYVMMSALQLRPHQDINIMTQIISFSLIGFCLLFSKNFSTKNFVINILILLSNATYSLYLLHVTKT